MNSGGAQDICYGCHTVSENGNQVSGRPGGTSSRTRPTTTCSARAATGPAWITSRRRTRTPRRWPGCGCWRPTSRLETSTTTPPRSRAPARSATAAPTTRSWMSGGRRGHARSLVEEDGSFVADHGESCSSCHEGRAALRAWGVTTNYFERDTAAADAHLGVTCAVCHDPHNGQYDGQLRFSISDGTFEGNLCMKCHTRRYEPTGSKGPHAPQGAVLTGTAGYWPPGYDTTAVAATHGNPAKNPRLCAGCHVNNFEVEDRLDPGKKIAPGDTCSGRFPASTRRRASRSRTTPAPTRRRPGSGGRAPAATGTTPPSRTRFTSIGPTSRRWPTLIWTDADGDQVLFTTNADGSFAAFDPGDTGLLTEIPNPAVAFNAQRRLAQRRGGRLLQRAAHRRKPCQQRRSLEGGAQPGAEHLAAGREHPGAAGRLRPQPARRAPDRRRCSIG